MKYSLHIGGALTPADLVSLQKQVLQIPEIEALQSSLQHKLIAELCDATGYAQTNIKLKSGKPGRQPDINKPIVMHDIRIAFIRAGITPTVWSYVGKGRQQENESALFKTYRVVAQHANLYAPVNLKPIVKNSEKIRS